MVLFKERGNNILVFLVKDCAGAVKQNTAGSDITGKVFKDIPLNGRQTGNILASFLTDLRLFSNHAKTRARDIGDHRIKSLSV